MLIKSLWIFFCILFLYVICYENVFIINVFEDKVFATGCFVFIFNILYTIWYVGDHKSGILKILQIQYDQSCSALKNLEEEHKNLEEEFDKHISNNCCCDCEKKQKEEEQQMVILDKKERNNKKVMSTFAQWLDAKSMTQEQEKYDIDVAKVGEFDYFEDEDMTILRVFDRKIEENNNQELQETNTFIIYYGDLEDVHIVKFRCVQTNEDKAVFYTPSSNISSTNSSPDKSLSNNEN